MKNLRILFTVSCILLGLTAASDANAEQIGLYAAPKFIWGFATSKIELDSSSAANQSFKDLKHNFTKGTPGGALSLGYDFSRLNPEATLRTEVELSFFKKVSVDKDWKNVKSKNHLELGALFFNIFYDIKNSTEFTPYIGAGLGASATKLKSDLEHHTGTQQAKMLLGKKTKKNLSWNVGAGVAYEFSEFFALDLGYRFVSFGKAESEEHNMNPNTPTSFSVYAKTKEIYMHQIILGARVTF